MKRITAITLFTLATLGAATAALAQQPAVQVNVPFDFTVGEKALPAGAYTITSSSPGIILVRNYDKNDAVSIVATHGNGESPDGSKLVFDVYGNQYFLHRILCPITTAMNVDFPTSKSEKKARARAQEAKLEVREQTLLALK